MITGRCLSSEDESTWIEVHIRILLQLVIQIHNMKNIQKLTLIFVKSLNLYIKDGTRIYLYTVVLLDVFCKTNLVLILDVHELLTAQLIVCINTKLVDMCQICDPVITDLLSHPIGKKRVAVKQESSLCDTVCLVVELLWHHQIEILKLLILENLCMKLCNTVYRETCCNCQMSHLNLTIINDSHLLNLAVISRISSLDLKNETTVDLLCNLINTRKQS